MSSIIYLGRSGSDSRLFTRRNLSPRVFSTLLLLPLFFFLSSPLVSAEGLETGQVLPQKLIIISAITIVLLGIGFLSHEYSYFLLAGSVMLFLLGFLINGGHIYLPTGLTTELYIYGDNYDGYHYDDYNGTTKVDEMNLFHMNQTKHYEAWTGTNSHLIGWLLMVISTVFFAMSLFSLRGDEY